MIIIIVEFYLIGWKIKNKIIASSVIVDINKKFFDSNLLQQKKNIFFRRKIDIFFKNSNVLSQMAPICDQKFFYRILTIFKKNIRLKNAKRKLISSSFFIHSGHWPYGEISLHNDKTKYVILLCEQTKNMRKTKRKKNINHNMNNWIDKIRQKNDYLIENIIYVKLMI